jgi:glutaredoxin
MSLKVEIYGRESCRFSVAAVAWCVARSFPCVLHAPGSDTPISALGRVLPQIFIGAHRIGGLEDLRASSALIQQILKGK